jgi:hypothetical protein
MGCTPALLYILGLLPFGLALAKFPPCTECYKRAFVGTSMQPYFVSYTHQQVGCYIGSYTPQVCKVTSRRYWKSQSEGNKAGYICNGK